MDETKQTDGKKETKKELKTTGLEDEVKFSWWRVMKNGVKNMKEDIDPVYKGAKIGVYALHSIPTWHREYKDGRLANDSNGFSTAAATFVLATEGTAYYIGTNEALAQYGPMGYAVLAIPLGMQAMSYTREAFRKAKKSEMGNVIQTRIQRRLSTEDTEKFDLSLKDMMNVYVGAAKTGIEDTFQHYESEGDELRNRTKKKAPASDDQANIKAYSAIGEIAENIFNELFAYDQVGSSYELYRDLTLVNKSNEKKRKSHGTKDYVNQAPEGTLNKLIWNRLAENNGSANIELLGKVTAIYKGQGATREVHYQVEPNELWKR